MGEGNKIPEGAENFVAPSDSVAQRPARRINFGRSGGVELIDREELAWREALIFKYELPDYMVGSLQDTFHFYDMIRDIDLESPVVALEIVGVIKGLSENQFKAIQDGMNTDWKIAHWNSLFEDRFFIPKLMAFAKEDSSDDNWKVLVSKALEFFGRPEKH